MRQLGGGGCVPAVWLGIGEMGGWGRGGGMRGKRGRMAEG